MSTAHDDIQTTTSPTETPVDEPSETPKYEFTWQDLRSCTKYINDRGWSQAPIPAILETFPENLVIGPQLQQILLWSLQRFDETPTDNEAVSEISTEPEPNPTAQGSLPSRMNTVIAVPKADVNEISTTLARAPSRRTLPLFTRLKQLRQDVADKVIAAGTSSTSSSGTSPVPEEAPTPAVIPNGECISCFDEFPKHDLVHLACSHDYCKVCLREVVLNAMKNESAFPPKCCLTEIPLKTVLVCLENNQRDEYKEKSAEYAIPAGHRWYCPEPKCSKWIRPEKLHRNRRTQQKCPFCKAGICSMCRSLAHDTNQDCPQDFGLESTLEVAESEGWRRCYSCRTMVELTTGCRHITCRCGAEFCYVCNARWRTCNCTEADKERRIRELRAQREQRTEMEEAEARRREAEDEAARLEAEEMAEAIRQVEELERQEAIRRVEEERQRQLEEELILARLEEARLLEEIARKEEEDEAERQFREILITSSKEECQAMMKTLMQIINYQHSTLMACHAAQEQNIIEEQEYKKAQHLSKSDVMLTWLQENVNGRTERLHSKQRSEWEALLLQAENEEDDLFMQMHMYLRDKPNRELREKKMRETFQKQQHERTTKLQQRQQAENQRLELGSRFEYEGLRKAANTKLEPIERENCTILHRLACGIGCDRQWFQTVSSRRIKMLNEHKRIVLQQLEAEEEPVGLSEEQARTILPTPLAPKDVEREQQNTDLTTLEGSPSTLAESSDLYGATNNERLTTNNLGRSDTVVRSIPGAFPTGSSVAMNMPNSGPELSSLSSSTINPRVNSPETAGSTMSLNTTPTKNDITGKPVTTLHDQSSIMDRPRPRRPFPEPSISTQSTSSHPLTSTPLDQYTPLNSNPFATTSNVSSLPFTSTANSSTSTLSATTNPSSRTSKLSHSSTSSTFADGDTDADLLDSISASVIAKHHSTASSSSSSGPSPSETSKGKKKGLGLGAVIKGLGKRAERREISEDEIRRRMSTRAVVGDGWGAGSGW